MKLTRYETAGIAASIAVLVLAIGVVRFFPFSKHAAETVHSSEWDIIVVDSDADNRDAALKAAILHGSTADGTVTKLIIHDVSIGSGREVRIGDTVTVHYIGLEKDGPQFDNSYKKKQPLSFKVGAGEVIEGWERGVIGMKEGGQRILVVPPAMAYGNTVVNSLPANATLIFSIELISIE